MKGANLGEFEEIVLLTVGLLYSEAYGLAIVDKMKFYAKRKVTLSAVYKVLLRLEEKGFLTSHVGGATKERGGRNKKLYTLTSYGKKAVNQARDVRNEMWTAIPDVVWKN